MAGSDEPPNSPDLDRHGWLGHGVDTGGRRFWFPSSSPDKYPWDIRGRYDIRDGEIHITELTIRPNPDAARPISGLSADRLRRFTRLSPIRRAIREQEDTDRERIHEAQAQLAAEGRPNAVIEEWAKRIQSSWAKSPKQSRRTPGLWVQWAVDYLRRVEAKGTSYGVQRDIADEGAWGVGYESVRERVKAMRRLGWITGEGHLVSPGPALTAHMAERDD